MAKVVYNACYGGFSVSEAGMRRYAEIKGLALFPELNRFGLTTYWLVPKEERTGIISSDDFHKASQKKRLESNRRYSELTLNNRDFCRHDPILVQVVEELGAAANGAHANLRIEEIPSGTPYRIDEYDGREIVATNDTYDWTVAP